MDSKDTTEQVAALAAKAAQGDRGAFRRLVDISHPTVYRLALRITGTESEAEDVVQETYIRVWKKLSTLKDPTAAFAWVCRIARNVAYDSVRKSSRRRSVSLDAKVGEGLSSLHELLESEEPGPERRTISRDLAQAVLAVVENLKEKHRTVLLLREVDGMSYEEMATALGCSIGTVESRLFRARKALMKRIGKLT